MPLGVTVRFPVLESGKFAVCYESLEIRYFDDWLTAEEYLYQVYVSKEHTGYYVKEL